MTVTTVVSEPGVETIPPEPPTTEVVETAAEEAALVTAEATIALAEAEAAAVTLRSEDEIRQLIGGLETWRGEVGQELSALREAVTEMREGLAVLTGMAIAEAPSSTLENSTPSETVEVETPTAAVTIAEAEPAPAENTPSAIRHQRRWT